MSSPLVVATRRSALALAQTRAFVRALVEANPGLVVEELHVTTSGDRIQDRPLSEIGGKGLFVREIEEALLDERADIAVHSMKDLPAHQPDGLVIACTPERADPRDVLLVRRLGGGGSASLDALAEGARVGSSSLRRRTALHRYRPDLRIQPLRGNVDTRVRKLAGGDFDAIILAAAGLARLGVDGSTLPPHAPLETTTMLPAVAQGILAIEARANDERAASLLSPMNHAPTRVRAAAERGVLRALDADCTVPLAAHAVFLDTTTLRVDAWLAEMDGSGFRSVSDVRVVRGEDEAATLGHELGNELLRLK